MMTSREQRIRMLAYRIWESEGRPDGQEARHWEMAERIVEAENAREEEQEWREAGDEPSPLEGEDPPAEPDEIGIDEPRLPLDDPETEARKAEDTGVEVHPAAPAKPSRSRQAGAKSTGRAKSPGGSAKKAGAGGGKPGTKADSKDDVKTPTKPRKKPGASNEPSGESSK